MPIRFLGSCVPGRDIPAFARPFRQGRLPVDRLVTHTLALDDVNEALDRLADGVAVRQVIRFEAGR
jgi:alcohol dehydrogenase